MRQFVQRAEETVPIPGYEPWLSRLLYARGITNARDAEAFLKPDLASLHDPLMLGGMKEAMALIRELGARGARAVVYGDYDVDGICAAVIAKEALEKSGLKTIVYIPDRHTEGYGINEEAVRALAGQAELMLTVDCGITAVREAALAGELGLRLIITDHHTPPEILPRAEALINPMLGGYPFPSLCGAGVAWKLSLALHGLEFAKKQLDLAALATIADMVPLLGENRVIASLGLKSMRDSPRLGLQALMDVTGLAEGQPVSADRVSFGLAPRLNAGGRLETAQDGLDLLTSERREEAAELALRLNDINLRRRQKEAQVIKEARAQIEGTNLLRAHSLVLCGEGWNSGVVGLAAGRLSEQYGLPTLVLSRDGETATGSGRTAGDVDLYSALFDCEDLFIRFGGHRAAAGMSLSTDRLPELKERFDHAVAAQLGGRPLVPRISYDAELSLNDITRDNIERLELLAPFGIGNPSPAFLLEDVERASGRRVGAEGKHLKLSLRKGSDVREGIAFGMGDRWEGMPPALRAIVRLSNNEFRGRITPQFELVDYQAGKQAFEHQPQTELDTLLEDLEAMVKSGPYPGADADEPGEITGWQGKLLLCRTYDTACRMRAMYPDYDTASGRYVSPRGVSAVLYNVAIEQIEAPCDALYFCDGLIGKAEAALAKARFPGAAIYAFRRTGSMETLLASMRYSLDELRRIYVQFRSGHGIIDAGRSPQAARAAALIFEEIGLLERSESGIVLKPGVKADPADSLVYQYLK